MEVLYIAGTLGALHHLFSSGESSITTEGQPQVTQLPREPPQPATNSIITPVSNTANTVRPIPMMPDRSKDSTNIMDDRSLEGRLGYSYDPDVHQGKSSREHPESFFSMDVGAVRNVHVRNDTNYRGRETQVFNPSQYMTGVNPTTQIRVGPGVGVGADQAAGPQGFHWGSTRMMPADVHVHHQLAGGIIPGKSRFDERTSLPHMRKQRPDTFFEVSENYQTSAPGRSVATGATARVEPEVRHTNRATELTREEGMGVMGVGPMTDPGAQRSRTAMENADIYTRRGTASDIMGAGPSMPVKNGHEQVQKTFFLPPEERNSTECASELLPVNNPGQPAFNSNMNEARGTMRQLDGSTGVLNISAQAPQATNRSTNYIPRTTDREMFSGGYVGTAQSMFQNSGNENEKQALSSGRLSGATTRETTHASYQGGASAYLSNPMSYEDILKSEGFSNRTLEQPNRIAGGERTNILNDKNKWTTTELPPLAPDFTRDGNLDRSAISNLHVVNQNLDTNPNRELPDIHRYDPSTILSNNLVPRLPTN